MNTRAQFAIEDVMDAKAAMDRARMEMRGIREPAPVMGTWVSPTVEDNCNDLLNLIDRCLDQLHVYLQGRP
jgi:hypothetical protein